MKNILKAIYTALVDNIGIGWIAVFVIWLLIAYSDPFNDRGWQGVLFGRIIKDGRNKNNLRCMNQIQHRREHKINDL